MELSLVKDKKFELHPFVDQNFRMLSQWWEARNFPAPQLCFLPPTGFIVSFQGQPVAAGFMFKTDAHVACIGHLVSNPTAPKVLRHPAVDYLIEFMSKLADEEDFGMVTCSTNIDKLGKRFESLGFTRTDADVCNYGRVF